MSKQNKQTNKANKTEETNQNRDLKIMLLEHTRNLLSLSDSIIACKVGDYISNRLMQLAMESYDEYLSAYGTSSKDAFVNAFRASRQKVILAKQCVEVLEHSSIPCDGQAVRKAIKEAEEINAGLFQAIKTLLS